MSTTISPSAVLFGRTRQAILSLIYTRPDESFYLREIVRRTGIVPSAVQRELAQLTACGILRRDKSRFFSANKSSPVFEPLMQLVIRTAGLADVLRDALNSVADGVVVAFLFGSFVRGEQRSDSDVDLMIVSTDSDLTVERIASILRPLQASLGREINPFVLPAQEFRRKIRAGNHFLHRVMEGEKIFLIGGEDELKRVAKERMVKATSNLSPGNRRSSRRRRSGSKRLQGQASQR
jgi:uncharacterized protein